MQYSPKLKKVMQEIKEILEKNDIAGFVVLHTPGFSEYLNKVDPSYSAAKIKNGGIRFRIKSAEVGKEKARELATNTTNMITHFAEMIGKHAVLYIESEVLLRERYKSDRSDGEETSSTEQNN